MTLVDVITKDPIIADKILCEYPLQIIPDKQYKKTKKGFFSEYEFLGIELESLIEFMNKEKINYNYFLLNDKERNKAYIFIDDKEKLN